MLLVRRLLEKLYPPYNEIAIFVMTVGLMVLVAAAPEFRQMLSSASYVGFVVSPEEAFQTGTWEGIKTVAGAVFVALMLVISVGASLYLPFTDRNLDALIGLVVLAHLLMVCASNVVAFDDHRDLVSGVFAGASLSYLVGLGLGLRFNLVKISTTARQASAKQALVMSLSVAVLVVVLSAGFNLHWAHCYAVAVGYAIGAMEIADRLSGAQR